MNIDYKPFAEINYLSKRDKAYQVADPRLKPFYKYDVNIEAFKEVIQSKKNHKQDRKTLVEVLKSQYSKLDTSTLQEENINLLSEENTYTIVTAHQPSLLTGPLYYIYKIASTINLCKQLHKVYPAYNFVPVFINGSEDHDFDEIDHVHLFSKTIKWEEKKRGPVGRLPIGNLQKVLDEVFDILGSSAYAENAKHVLSTALDQSTIYNEFTAQIVQSLFGRYGLIAINMDDKKLKSLFVPIIKKEIFDEFSISHITKTQEQLNQAGFKSQAFPRDINFFYLGEGFRERIEKVDGLYRIVNKSISFTKNELENEINKFPERFSPNVNMRPLYQEQILPNLAYIGGGGELAYWMERMSQFAEANIPFPMLIRRNSALLISKGNQKTMSKLNLSVNDVWDEEHVLVTRLLENASNVDINVELESKMIEKALKDIAARAKSIDPGLEKFVLSEKVKAIKNVEQIGARLKRAIKSQEEVKVKQIKSLKEKLFPNGGLQERHDNFFQYYITYGRPLLDLLVHELDPMNKAFVTIELDG